MQWLDVIVPLFKFIRKVFLSLVTVAGCFPLAVSKRGVKFQCVCLQISSQGRIRHLLISLVDVSCTGQHC